MGCWGGRLQQADSAVHIRIILFVSSEKPLSQSRKPWRAIREAVSERVRTMHSLIVWLAQTVEHQFVPVSRLLCLFCDKVCGNRRRSVLAVVRFVHRNHQNTAYIYVSVRQFIRDFAVDLQRIQDSAADRHQHTDSLAQPSFAQPAPRRPWRRCRRFLRAQGI